MAPGRELRTAIAILGAGPTGLGAAWRLLQYRSPESPGSSLSKADEHQPFLLMDESKIPGGRAASFTTAEGFTFDYGGHVLFPHAEYAEFIELLEQVIPEWHYSTPIRGVWVEDRLIPTPVQRNIHRLRMTTLASCLWGLARRSNFPANGKEPNLQEHLEQQFGKALSRYVMAPLNQKMWAHAPSALGSAWSSHRSGSKEKNIPEVRVRGILRNLILNRDEPGWDARTTVRYPKSGGVGSIWRRVLEQIPEQFRQLGTRVSRVEAGAKMLHFSDGRSTHYEQLVSSIPMDQLLMMIADRSELQRKAAEFRRAKVQLFGFGIEGEIPAKLQGVHAINVPDPKIPFWRVNFPGNFSPGNLPKENCWSVLCECSVAPDSKARFEPEQIETALRKMGFIPRGDRVISIFQCELAHGYPVPFQGRETLLKEVQRELEQLQIYSRGRFGGWRYEVSNQDHAFMQGVEVVDRIVKGKAEATYCKTW